MNVRSIRAAFFFLVSIIAVFALNVTPASAATYYVSPTGSDTNNGTSQNAAWKTISKVNATAFGPGDQLLFEGGKTFSGNIYFPSRNSGTPSSPITISSYGTGRATIAAGTSFGFFAYNTAGIAIRNINFSGSGSTSNTSDGILFYVDQSNSKLDTVIINNVDVGGFGKSGIDIGGWNGSSGYKNVTITYVDAHDNAQNGIFFYAATSDANQNIYIGHVAAYNNTGIPGASNPTGSGITLGEVSGAVVERSVAYNNGALNTNSAGPVGIWAYDSTNVTIQYNESHHNHTNSTGDGDGFDLDGAVTNSVMQYNYSHDNDGAGYLISQYSGSPRTTSDNTVRYNISQNDGRKNGNAGIFMWNGGSGIANTKIYHNTIYMGAASSGSPAALWIYYPTTNTQVYNNVFTTDSQRLVDVASAQTNAVFRGNDYWATSGNFQLNWGNATHDPAELRVNPLVQQLGGGGTIGSADQLSSLSAYMLTAASPMIGKGISLPALGIQVGPYDYYGTPIPQGGTFDIGASEFVSPTNSDTTPPSIPANLSGVVLSSSAISLSWSASTDASGVAGYSIFRDGVKIAAAASPSYSDSGLSAATSYTYNVAAYDAAGNTSAQSAPAVVTTLSQTSQPVAVFNVGARVQTTSAINVRNKASLSGKIVGTQSASALGTIKNGPKTNSGYIWWQVNFDSGSDGWVVQDYLSVLVAAESEDRSAQLAAAYVALRELLEQILALLKQLAAM